ncbi:hypothetical protein M569_15207, partial [Genlisea aurea]
SRLKIYISHIIFSNTDQICYSSYLRKKNIYIYIGKYNRLKKHQEILRKKKTRSIIESKEQRSHSHNLEDNEISSQKHKENYGSTVNPRRERLNVFENR